MLICKLCHNYMKLQSSIHHFIKNGKYIETHRIPRNQAISKNIYKCNLHVLTKTIHYSCRISEK